MEDITKWVEEITPIFYCGSACQSLRWLFYYNMTDFQGMLFVDD
jgi:hypothetical protein